MTPNTEPQVTVGLTTLAPAGLTLSFVARGGEVETFPVVGWHTNGWQ